MELNADRLHGPDDEGGKPLSLWLLDQGQEKPEVEFVNYDEKEGGRHFGYGYLIKANRKLFKHNPKSRLAFHCCSPFGVDTEQGKINIVSSMWESKDLFLSGVRKLRTVDAIITPSKWCTKIFKQHVDCPVYTLPLWIDPRVWTYKKRTLPKNGKFRWLWLASVDPRKGWPIVASMWEKFFANNPNVELYMKTSSDRGNDLGVTNHGNTIIDRRILPRGELVDLYHSAHGFIYPSGGEGFGWTCAEALSTGLPVVGTSVTGHRDFFDERFGHVVSTVDINIAADEPTTAGDNIHMYVATSASLGERMNQVMHSYDKALKRARAGSENIQKNFTFERYVNGLYSILGKYS